MSFFHFKQEVLNSGQQHLLLCHVVVDVRSLSLCDDYADDDGGGDDEDVHALGKNSVL